MTWITRQAEVVSTQAGQVEVRACEPAGCQSCSLAGGCGRALQLHWLQGSPPRLMLKTEQPLKPGDRVLIELDATSFQRALLLQFVLPLAGLLLAAILAEGLMLSLHWTALIALAGFLSGLWLVRCLDRQGKLRLLYRLDGLHRLDGKIDLASD